MILSGEEGTMSTVAECANPKCNAEFLRLSDGKLCVSSVDNSCFIWLCETCMKLFTVEWQGTKAVLAYRIPKRDHSASA
jgi:hypothetical protein